MRGFGKTIFLIALVCLLGGCERGVPFSEVEITAARLENIEMGFVGIVGGQVEGSATLVVTPTTGEELASPVTLEGGLVGAVWGVIKADKILEGAAPIRADFDLSSARERIQRSVSKESGESTSGDPTIIIADRLFGPYMGLKGEGALALGMGGDVLVNGQMISDAITHPSLGFGLALALQSL